jgi:hypothetical protein
MDPKNNPLWNIMMYITSKLKYNKSNFKRIKDKKFVEDENELTKVGKEMFDSFNTKLRDIFFLDICGAPGMYSKILIDKNSSGIGISLPPEKGGVEFNINQTISSKYKFFYKDILEKEYKIELKNKLKEKEFNLGLASCVSYIDTKDSHSLNLELILTSMNLILEHLQNNGDMIINLTMKNIYTCFNILDLILEQFDYIKLWKSSTVWADKYTFYIFCYNYNKSKKINMLDYIDKVTKYYYTDDFNHKYVGHNYNYDKINKMMNDIYIVRINALLKNISSQV